MGVLCNYFVEKLNCFARTWDSGEGPQRTRTVYRAQIKLRGLFRRHIFGEIFSESYLNRSKESRLNSDFVSSVRLYIGKKRY